MKPPDPIEAPVMPLTPGHAKPAPRSVGDRWMVLAAAYLLLWGLLAHASDSFWFLPAGLRLALLWITPPQRTRWLWPIEGAAIGLFLLTSASDPAYSALGLPGAALLLGFNLFVPLACYLAAVRLFAPNAPEGMRLRNRDVGRLLAAALVGALGNALLLWLRDVAVAYWLGQAMPAPAWVYAIGDYIGCFMIAPVLVRLLLCEQGFGSELLDIARAWGGLLPAAVAWLALQILQADECLLVLTLAVATLFLVAHVRGWTAAAIGVVALSATAHQAPLGSEWSIAPWVLQVVVAVVGSGAVLLGASSQALRVRIREERRLGSEVRLARRELQQATARLVANEEAERQRIGRDLHDGLGQSLTALRTRSHLLRRGLADPRASDWVREFDELVELAQHELRAVLEDFNPVELDRLGFERALSEGSIAGMLTDRGIDFRCEIEPGLALESTLAANLFRICQEAASNAVKAAQARSFGLRLRRRGPGLCLEISDDGGGIHPSRGPGLGLQGIRDRAVALQAAYEFNPGHGQPRHRLLIARPECEAPGRAS